MTFSSDLQLCFCWFVCFAREMKDQKSYSQNKGLIPTLSNPSFARNSFHDTVLLVLFNFLYLVSSWKAIPDSQSFLFTLANPSGNEPTRLNPKPGAAIRCMSNAGPAFGNSTHFDLYVWYQKVGSGLDLGFGFTCPENVNGITFFTGGSLFQVTELEVFKVNL